MYIWTFAGSSTQVPANNLCPCAKNNHDFPPASFVGSDYFRDSGNWQAGATTSKYYLDNPLFDGQGCLPTDNCCRFNNPPWFYQELPESTSNSLKLHGQLNYRPIDEDIIITEIELYILP